MYKIEDASLEDFKSLVPISTENYEPEYSNCDCEQWKRLVVDGETYVVVGMVVDNAADGTPYYGIQCALRNDISKVTKTLVKAAKEYLSTLSDKPAVALALMRNKTYYRFLEFLGFKFLGEYCVFEEANLVYRVYVRGANVQ